MYQELEIIGNVGRVGELKVVGEQSKSVINFSVAVNERLGDQDVTTWFEVTAWNGLSQVIADHVVPGQLVMVKGRVSAKLWQDQQGNNRVSLQLSADTFRMLGKKPENK